MIGVRDYIHVVDLAKGHITALKKLREDCGCKVRLKHIFLPMCAHSRYLLAALAFVCRCVRVCRFTTSEQEGATPCSRW